MLFWILAALLTLIVVSALYYAGRSTPANAGSAGDIAATNRHFRAQLAAIEADIAAERLSDAEAEAAKAELAREVLRRKDEIVERGPGTPKALTLVALAAIAGAAFGIYSVIGQPALPAQPLAAREAARIDVADAVGEVEARLRTHPDDARGWAVIGPVYMQAGRFDDAAAAFRNVLRLAAPTADAETDLAEALMMASNGSAGGEPLILLQSAAARDPNHIRSRFYLAGEATRAGDWQNAIDQWKKLLALGNGTEPWALVARNGLAAAGAGLAGNPLPEANMVSADPVQAETIRNMVEGLSERLASSGGSIEEWTRLVRSRLVLGEKDKAQEAYDAAKAAYPDAASRGDIDALAKDAGLD